MKSWLLSTAIIAQGAFVANAAEVGPVRLTDEMMDAVVAGNLSLDRTISALRSALDASGQVSQSEVLRILGEGGISVEISASGLPNFVLDLSGLSAFVDQLVQQASTQGSVSSASASTRTFSTGGTNQVTTITTTSTSR
jgi:hypothetical protein